VEGSATLLKFAYRLARTLASRRSQSNEAAILSTLSRGVPKTFVEFGFHPSEFNCVSLSGFSGLLIDGDATSVRVANLALPRRLRAVQSFLTLDNLDVVRNAFPALGVLSIDVDGNDYWFLQALLPLRPHVVAVEYNGTFGLRSITVPYDAAFERHLKHPSGWYHGASLAALSSLCERHDMKLVAVSEAGTNAFFVRQDRPEPRLSIQSAYKENALRNQRSGTTAAQQWERIKHMPFESVQ
jgi:hypothetical protein